MFWNRKNILNKIEVSAPVEFLVDRLKSIYGVARIDKVEELNLIQNTSVSKGHKYKNNIHGFDAKIGDTQYSFKMFIMQVPQPYGLLDGTLWSITMTGTEVNNKDNHFALEICRDTVKLHGNIEAEKVYTILEELYEISLQIKRELNLLKREDSEEDKEENKSVEQGKKFVSCNCGEWDCYYKQLCKVSEKLENIDGIAHYRMGEVDTHLRNRLVDIQNVIRGD